ncbi:MAG: hypothetical protein K6T85_06265 [Gorillibacterium sp.]|nr:hypothetical protein [Gorillibacterium sp.]
MNRIWMIIALPVLTLVLFSGCSKDKAEPASPLASSSSSPITSTGTSSPVATATPIETAIPSPSPTSVATAPHSYEDPQAAKRVIEQRAAEVIAVLAQKDSAKLAKLAYPVDGIQFSPYSFIDPVNDQRITPTNLATLLSSSTVMNWGTYDGSGDPIQLTFAAYWAKFIYDHPFATAPSVTYNLIVGKGNMSNNVFSLYPPSQYITVEYHFDGFDQQYAGMDWSSLRIVFAPYHNNWYVTAIMHDQWTT